MECIHHTGYRQSGRDRDTAYLAPEATLGRILPGPVLTLLVGLGTIAYLGIRLARRQDRSHVTA